MIMRRRIWQGFFDAVGGREDKKAYLQKCDFVDDAVFGETWIWNYARKEINSS